jgi:tRNA(fMet)-specific endonuclease VapC
MSYLLDTDICITLIRHKPPALLQHITRHTLDEIAISSITAAELQFGVQKSQYPERNQRALEQFLLPLSIIAFDYAAAMHYGQIRAALERQGTPIGALDLLIAAHALSLTYTLVTNNEREFARVPGLQWENWASAEGTD